MAGPEVAMFENITHHAASRIRQRGFRETDAEVVLENGTPSDDGVVLTRRDIADRISEYRARIAELERLRGAAIFLADGRVLSVYRPGPKKVRRMIREGRSRATR
jgi:hypothetical protein